MTHVDENRVYAFGHPMYNLGPIEFPMTRAFVYIVLPSLMSSGKLSSTGDIVGTFNQDRSTAIAGHLGGVPELYGLVPGSGLSLHTAFGLLVLALHQRDQMHFHRRIALGNE